MSILDDPHVLGRARLSFADRSEVDEFVTTLDRFERGEIGADEWRSFRLLRGAYGQRQEGSLSMIRVKIPQGILDGPQLRALAEVAERWSRGFGHVTTRQNVQLHFVELADVSKVLDRLADVGLTTREACGNSVRNITACQYAGVAADELFDVTPYAEALTRFLLRHRLAAVLPRKFKTAFEGCPVDHAQTAIHDLGFRAVLLPPDTFGGPSRRGFRVSVGGGTSIKPTSAQVLEEALPASEILAAAEAVLRVYHRLGDYQHRQRNRIKYLIKEIGFPKFREEYARERDAIREAAGIPFPFPPDDPTVEEAPDWPRADAPTLDEVARRVVATATHGPGQHPSVLPVLPATPGHSPDAQLASWTRDNVREQRQHGYVMATVTLPIGDITSEQLRVLADLVEAYGDGGARATAEQNLLLRWVRHEDVPALHARLAAAGLGTGGAGTLADVVSCPGAESCKLAITRSRGLGQLLADSLRELPELVAAAPGLDVKVSGCPNGCSRHHVAGIGFQGSVRRLGERLVPQYFVTVGGGAAGDDARFGRLVGKIPARRGPEAVRRLLALYIADRKPGESALEFLQRVEPARAKAALVDLEKLAIEDALPEDFIDLGDAGEMTVVTMEGECSA